MSADTDGATLTRRQALAGGITAALVALSQPASAGHNPDDGPVGDFAIRLGDLDGNGEPVDEPTGRKRLLYISPEEINGGNDDRLFYTTWHDDQWHQLEFFGTGGGSGSSKWADTDTDGLLEPADDETGIDVTTTETDELGGPVSGGTTVSDLTGAALEISSGALGVAANGIDSTELADDAVGATQLADGSVSAAKIQADAAGPSEVDLAAIAGEFLEENTNTASLDVVESPEWVDSDGDGLLETRDSGIDGAEVGRVRTTTRSEYPTANQGDFQVKTSGDQFVISNTSTAQGVVSISARGPALAVSSVISSSTTVRDRAKIVLVDSSGTAGVTITLGTELEIDGLPLVVKDAGGSAALNPITVTTESGAPIDGSTSQSIGSDYGAASFAYAAGPGEWFSGPSSGL